MNPCAGMGKRHPRAYIGVAGGAEWPYSVAWISQRLAEPRTRVQIAVGPLNHAFLCFVAHLEDSSMSPLEDEFVQLFDNVLMLLFQWFIVECVNVGGVVIIVC